MAGAIDDNQRDIIKEAVRQFVDAQMQGQQLDIDEFVKKYPGLDSKIREGIKELQKINALFDSLVQTDESDFEEAAAGQELVGRKKGSFEIVEMIGRGGMGVVYLARDTRLDRSVAIKSVPPKLADDSTARMRFHREAKLLASLNHPNIAVIYEIIEKEDTGYLVLEYVPGETLAQRIAREPLKLEEALSIAKQIADAVSAAHEKGVIHRDLKPGNIKIMPEGRVKVLDFGLAKSASVEAAVQDITVTQIGSVIGTPAYMSPEQLRGDPADKRSDIWSFGCVLYEMLTSKRPFEGKTVSDTLAHILERQPDWQALPQDTPANIQVLLRRCLEKDPVQRHGDIGDSAIEISETLSKPQTAMSMMLRRIAMIVSAVAVGVILFGIALKYIPQKEIRPLAKEIRLVVLPFENLGPAEDEYFADSVTDQITSHLAPIRGLSVLSPRTAAQYEKGKKNARQIGQELGVDYILEGKVQREHPSDQASPVRVMPRLVSTSEDRLVLAPIYPIYNDDLNELYQVQSDLAEQVTQALNVTLLEPERQALASRPTENNEAHKYYLGANDYFHRSYEEEDFTIAIRMYEKAVDLDPAFALAWSRLSLAHSWMYWFHDRCDKRLNEAKQAVDKAFKLNPDLPEAYSAMGRYYYNLLDFDGSLEQFAIARKRLPNDSEILSYIGFAQRRQGKFEQALANLKRACELDPLSGIINMQIGSTLMILRRYAEAESYYKRGISLSPDEKMAYSFNAQLYLLAEGKTEKAWAVFEGVPKDVLENDWIILRYVELCVFDRDYQKALDRLSSYEPEAFDTQFLFIPKVQLYALVYGLMGNQQLEEEYFESARDLLKAKVQQHLEDARFHSSLGIVYAGLGRKEDAIREGKLAVELLPVSTDAWRGCYRVKDLAHVYVMVGEFDEAIEKLKFLLDRPSEMSTPLLQLDPTWDPLRDHPRFKKLIKEDK